MLPLLASLLMIGQAVAEPSSSGQTATLFSTVGNSEWCPAGNVSADLRTGAYTFTARASRLVCNDPDLQRPVIAGKLSAAQLAVLQQAYRRARAEGLNVCRNGVRPPEIIISNGGPRILVVTDGRSTSAAPQDLGCWSDAAKSLYAVLQDTFPS